MQKCLSEQVIKQYFSYISDKTSCISRW